MARTFVKIGGGGPIVKWTTPGQTVEGKFLGLRQGKFGPLASFQTDDGNTVTMPAHAVLADRFATIPVGTVVLVEYKGKSRGAKSGNEFKDFDVFVESAEPGAEPRATPPMTKIDAMTAKLAAKDGIGDEAAKRMVGALRAKHKNDEAAVESALAALLAAHGAA
jgi:hypothetical protein